ncbi:MAG: putative DNA binding domain-containing protein [Deltaproteobacteria bacterium]|nr:putative DNA binding domain-containing protein [Deltaproteobacteria bacterium]
MDDIIQRALKAKRESKYIEFKESFDLNSAGDWCEIIKDIIAMANSGGGVIVFGLNNKGNISGFDVNPILQIDSAKITDRVFKYTGVHFSDFDIVACEKDSVRLAALRVLSAPLPMVFSKPGTYAIGDGKQKTAFGQGTMYFRHGAKSEPATNEDIQRAFGRRLQAVQKNLMKGVRKVFTAPPGYQVTVLPPEVVESDLPGATPIRIVDDPSAPIYRKIDPDTTYPFRQKEVLAKINSRLPKEYQINQFDMLAMRRVYEIDGQEKYYHRPKYSSPQYSQAFVDRTLERFREDKNFFKKTREKYRKLKV